MSGSEKAHLPCTIAKWNIVRELKDQLHEVIGRIIKQQIGGYITLSNVA